MIRKTVHRVGDQLEKMANKKIPVEISFDLMIKKAKSLEEMVVIEVMRESYLEMSEMPKRMAS